MVANHVLSQLSYRPTCASVFIVTGNSAGVKRLPTKRDLCLRLRISRWICGVTILRQSRKLFDTTKARGLLIIEAVKLRLPPRQSQGITQRICCVELEVFPAPFAMPGTSIQAARRGGWRMLPFQMRFLKNAGWLKMGRFGYHGPRQYAKSLRTLAARSCTSLRRRTAWPASRVAALTGNGLR